ncbi:MAG: DUF1501 domain-containing protein [Planctomycetes bacterium]|nr:DUF1501 domain-containing protein [Planctomycetota bacterium]
MTCKCNHENAGDAEKPGMDRRTALKVSLAAVGAAALAPRLPAEAIVRPRMPASRLPGRATVVVFERGGWDALQLFAPTGDANYALKRPTTAIGAPGSGAAVTGLAMNSLFSMHPSMPGLHSLWTQPASRLAVVHALGYTPYHRSHFESQDLFETGQFGVVNADGWINRHLQATTGISTAPVRALALMNSLPRSMDGVFPCFAFSSLESLQFQATQPDLRAYLETIVDYTPTVGLSAARAGSYAGMKSTFDLIDMFSGINPATYVPQNGAVYPNTAMGSSFEQTAMILRGNLGVEFIQIDQGGWDHHADLFANIPTYAGALNGALSAFVQDMGADMADVAVLCMSEFGREVSENGSNGTDHGVGGAMMIAGGSVLGGQVHGAWPGLATSALAEGRFLAPANDFRQVILELLMDHMGGTVPSTVFPSMTYAPLGVF